MHDEIEPQSADKQEIVKRERKPKDAVLFSGFTPPKKNYFHMPNNWTDITADINNLAELKVVEYILRHTWGYQEYGVKKAITTDEFMHGRKRSDGTRMDRGTCLSNRSVIDGLRAAIEHGYILCELDETDKARKIKSYTLKMSASDVKVLHIENNETDVKGLHTRCEDASHLTEGSSHHGEDASHLGYENASHRSEKDTPKTLEERHLRKDTLGKQSADAPVFGVLQQKEKRTPKRTGTPPTQESLIDPKEIIFSEEEDRIYGYWCNLKAHNGFKQKKSTSMKEHFKRLAPVISSQEELQMLWDYARGLAFNQGKGIYPGTLANAYPGWRSSLPVQNAPDSPPTHTKRQPKPDHEIVFWTTDPKGVSSKHSNPLSWDYMTVAEAKAQDNGYKDGRLLIPIDEDNVKADKITLQQQQARKVAVNA